MNVLPSVAAMGRGSVPVFVPRSNGLAAAQYADFATGHYWCNNFTSIGSEQSGFSAWLSGAGGSFTRASAATRVNEAGLLESVGNNVPRFDYDPVTLAARGVLLEGARSNLCLYSEQFNNAAWSAAAANVSANAGVAPDGNTTADRITFTAQYGNVNQSIDLAATTTHHFSVWLKYESGHTGLHLTVYNTVSHITDAYPITLVNDGLWHRYSVTFNDAGGANAYLFYIQDRTGGGGYGSILAWGAQVEAGLSNSSYLLTSPSSYIPTTSAAVTRAADSLILPWTAIASGTLYAKADSANVAVARDIAQLDDGSENNRATLSFTSGAAGGFNLLSGGASQAALSAGTISANIAAKLAAAFATNDFALVTAGGSPATDASGSMPSFTTLRFGADSAGATDLFGHLAELAVWNNVRASNAELQRLTA